MTDKEYCSNCAGAHDCKTIYEQMGKAQGPSVAKKVIVVFLLPIIVFVVCLVVLDKKLVAVTGNEHLRILLGVLLAGLMSLVYVLIAGRMSSGWGGAQHRCQPKETNDRDEG
ncbi:MAG: hypothetical protein DRP66_12000 [Planctomycetota bacterium]|nr:MAG: hypothetical protein DRP66_12000 [Planctomycetota bacterium]